MKNKRKQELKKLKQGIYFLPNLFTTANLFAGCFSIINAINGNYNFAAIAIFIAVFLDGMDGKIARVTNATLNFVSSILDFSLRFAKMFEYFFSTLLVDEKLSW